MLFLFILSSVILLSDAYIPYKRNENILEGCINELLDYIDQQGKKLVCVINTNIRIKNYSAVFFNGINEISKMATMFPDIYLLSGNITEMLNVLYQLERLNNLKYFIFNVQKIDEEIIYTLGQYFISKALFLTLNPEKGNYEIYKMVSTNYELIDIWQKPKGNALTIKNKINKSVLQNFAYLNVFYDIAPPFIISTREGIHMELLNIIVEGMKVKLNFIKSLKPTIIADISSEFISNRTYDLYVALFAAKFSTGSHSFDETVRITEDTVVFVTPNLLVTNNWTILYGELTYSGWAYFVLLLVILSMVIALIDRLVPEKKHTNVLSFLLSVLFEGTFTLYSKKRSIRILFMNYLIFVLILTTIYKSQMFNIMRSDNAYNPIQCRMDMLKFKFKMCLSTKLLWDFFQVSKDPIEHYFGLHSEVIVNGNYWECVNMAAYERNTVTFILSKRLEYAGPEAYLDENGFPLINILFKDYHGYLYFPFAFRKGHPLLNIFNQKLTILRETGFVQYQYNIYKRQFEKAVAVSKTKNTFYFKALNFKTLQSVFYVYIASIFISSLVFGLELILGRKLKQN
ncbi:Ionotropic receptor 135 [Diabrotica virgifera virgifera]|nr:Ionotropic receptor 135 [Diabrotica virgifera virgifera]